MIGRLRGILLEKQPPGLLIEIAGVGYEVDAPMSVFYRLPEVGQEVTLYTHFVVREDAQLLYGFADRKERELFRTLIRVNGVGPKLALTILSGIESSTFIRCVHSNDSASLVKLPGVGKKTAERLIVEMRDKLDGLGESFAELPGIAPLPGPTAEAGGVADAVSALVSLGYKPAEASRAVARVEEEGLSSEELIRRALKGML
ncbi:Holliday junction branch migration protein RuvA [Aestuariirhabdus litorea]|uniref:Holliday junction branch migration complex subunit RuvA n=1 Tax=Aestuariirhabdus litorea TaxID=2528527 RepID=A0A3P3VTU1_9GAMM|nr:Holliday junction branch migration protein RuvA [Aestuariirhabdus litorea]RRJ84173.1 Holliday junction branch migration protein RuvA [Aestuariirhabdus litorea]RWW97393.1 Holliday junction branch migration protein RuvA [Endozoicomonadaceae bacterium GTF-13]